MKHLTFEDLNEGDQADIELTITRERVDRYTALSGDINPLHNDDDFARGKGYEKRVVHGFFLGAMISRFLGVDMIGENCLIHSVDLRFKKPCYIDDTIRIEGEVLQKTDFGNVAVIRIRLKNARSGDVLCTGKIQAGVI